MNKILINLFSIIVISSTLISCSDFLERESTDYSSDGFYKSEAAVKDGVSGCYSLLYIENMGYKIPSVSFLDHYTGMAMERTQNTSIGAGGGLNADNAVVQNYWSSLYSIIARVNSVLYGSKEYISNLDEEARQYLAEAKILRSYAYYNLIGTYGDIPFFTEPVTIEQYKDTRKSKVEILDFILTDLDEAATVLPWIANERGRVDKAVAYGLKARAALLGGSLNYGGEEKKYFRIAADAANQVIGKRALAYHFDDLFNITGQAKSDVRDEMLWELMYSDQGTPKTHMVGFGQVSRNYGQTGRHPSMLLADTYECIDGKRIDESSLYDVHHPNKNRDPRFKSTLWMHGDTVMGNQTGTESGLIKLVINAYDKETQFFNFTSGLWEERNNADINSAAAWASFCNAGSGYLWAKYSNEKIENISKQSCNIPIMRYAEILLSYAEAKIELNELDASVYNAINEVRNRVGMPNVSADRIGSQEKMRQLVRRERKVELIFEGLHHIDMRRWGIGDLENGQPSYGLPIESIRYKGLSDSDIPSFNKSDRHDLNDIANYDLYKDKLKVRDINRFWDKKFELWPIPQLERDRNPSLTQNEGY